jgi:hypothetical protein
MSVFVSVIGYSGYPLHRFRPNIGKIFGYWPEYWQISAKISVICQMLAKMKISVSMADIL